MKRVVQALLMSLLLTSLTLHAAKPRAPLQVSITPVQVGLVSADIKPGDAVEFKITGKSFADSAELSINVELHGGLELLSGDTSWTGSANKGESKVMLITVRTPKHGNGRIKARMSMSPSAVASFATETEYRFGKQAERKPAALPAVKKDSKGRDIREYRVE